MNLFCSIVCIKVLHGEARSESCELLADIHAERDEHDSVFLEKLMLTEILNDKFHCPVLNLLA